jgi:hypothetical protein
MIAHFTATRDTLARLLAERLADQQLDTSIVDVPNPDRRRQVMFVDSEGAYAAEDFGRREARFGEVMSRVCTLTCEWTTRIHIAVFQPGRDAAEVRLACERIIQCVVDAVVSFPGDDPATEGITVDLANVAPPTVFVDPDDTGFGAEARVDVRCHALVSPWPT